LQHLFHVLVSTPSLGVFIYSNGDTKYNFRIRLTFLFDASNFFWTLDVIFICIILIYSRYIKLFGSWDSSVSIVSDYRLSYRDSTPGRGKGFSSSLCVKTSSEVHPASCPVGTEGKARQGRGSYDSPHLVPRWRMFMSCTSSPPFAYMTVAGQLLTIT
jgi:hypothetical protein